jgi:hypothetical protein
VPSYLDGCWLSINTWTVLIASSGRAPASVLGTRRRSSRGPCHPARARQTAPGLQPRGGPRAGAPRRLVAPAVPERRGQDRLPEPGGPRGTRRVTGDEQAASRVPAAAPVEAGLGCHPSAPARADRIAHPSGRVEVRRARVRPLGAGVGGRAQPPQEGPRHWTWVNDQSRTPVLDHQQRHAPLREGMFLCIYNTMFLVRPQS